MKLAIQDVSLDQILKYICKQSLVDIPIWERVVLDQAKTVTPMMRNGAYAKFRKGYGLFVEGTMVGYAVVYEPDHTLDLIHITKGCRGQGLGEWFLRDLGIERVTVDAENEVAVKLYEKLGYEIEFIKE